MASKNQVTLTFAGDTDQLEKAFGKVGAASKDAADDFERSSKDITKSFDGVGNAAGDLDTRAMGFRDGITGVQDTMGGWSKLMKGDVTGGLLELGMGVGDLASSVENLVVPLAKTGLQSVKTSALWVKSHVAMAASTIATYAKVAAAAVAGAARAAAAAVVSVATQVAAWVVLGVQSLIAAAKVALAWLIAMGPIALVIAAVIGLVYLIVRNWDTIKRVISAGWEFVKRITASVWNGIKSVVTSIMGAVVGHVRMQINVVQSIFRALRSGIGAIMSGVADMITQPFRVGFGAIKGIWNKAIGGKGFTVPDWIPKPLGGKSFKIPKLADGGIVSSPTLALIGEAGPEAVVPLNQYNSSGAGSPVVLELRSSGSALDDVLLEVIRRAVHSRGGDVVRVFG